MTNRIFAQRLNSELDEMGMPQRMDERIEVFAKFIKAPRFKAEEILNGTRVPGEDMLKLIANELEVSTNWLLGKEMDKH